MQGGSIEKKKCRQRPWRTNKQEQIKMSTTGGLWSGKLFKIKLDGEELITGGERNLEIGWERENKKMGNGHDNNERTESEKRKGNNNNNNNNNNNELRETQDGLEEESGNEEWEREDNYGNKCVGELVETDNTDKKK